MAKKQILKLGKRKKVTVWTGAVLGICNERGDNL